MKEQEVDWPSEIGVFRDATGFRICDIAAMMGVSHDTVSSWSCGRAIPRRTMRVPLLCVMHYLSYLCDNGKLSLLN